MTLWTVASQAPLSMGFSRQEYCSRLPCPPPGDLSDSGIELLTQESPATAGGFFTAEPLENASIFYTINRLHLLKFYYILYNVTEKTMAIHSSTFAWKIPRMEEPGGLQSMGSLKVRHC